MYTDSWFMSAADEGIRHHLDFVKSPIYYYLFGFRGSTSLTAIFGDPVNDYGKFLLIQYILVIKLLVSIEKTIFVVF